MADHRDFSRRLKQACDQNSEVPVHGKGQQIWFSDRMELSQEAVRRWFEGVSRPRPKKMTQLAKLLNVDEAWLALGISQALDAKAKRQYSNQVEAAAYMVFGIFMAAGYNCAFAEDDDPVDFYAIKSGKQKAVAVTMARSTSKNIFVAPIRPDHQKSVNVAVVSPEDHEYEFLFMDQQGVERYGDPRDGTIDVTTVRRDKNYYTDTCIWKQLKNAGIL